MADLIYIQDTGLSQRTINALEREGYRTLHDIAAGGLEKLRWCRGIGVEPRQRIFKMLKENKMAIGPENTAVYQDVEDLKSRVAALESELQSIKAAIAKG